MLYPTQVRSMDPYDKERWSSVYNLRSRILTSGKDVILYPNEAFTLSYENADEGQDITVGPGLIIKDDNMIHFPEDYVFNTADSEVKIMLDDLESLNTNSANAYLFIQYRYERTFPPKQARYIWMKDLTPYIDETAHYMYLGRIQFIGSNVSLISAANYSAPRPGGGTILLARSNFIPWCGSVTGNGGVVRDGGWFDDWE